MMNIPKDVQVVIDNKLTEIEQQENIRILYSCESGSRAWGFPSPDSDYDVRFIYMRGLDNYLSLMPKKDQLTYPINDELDFVGWDVVKLLKLMTKSNTTPFEWLQSPVIYREDEAIKKQLWDLCQGYFGQRGNTFHYVGIAESAMSTMKNEQIGIKKLFYVLRPLLAATWCIEKNSIAPMNIYPMLELLPEDLRDEVVALIKLKETVHEGYLITIEPKLKNWIMTTFDECRDKARLLEKSSLSIEKADDYFKSLITGYRY